MNSSKDGQFEIQTLPIIGQYGVQRFKQFGCEDTANFYLVKGETTKRPFAMYPTFGRKHVSYLGTNQFIFDAEPRGLFKSIDYLYVVVGNSIYRYDSGYVKTNITLTSQLVTFSGPVYFTFLVVNSIVFSCFVDGQKIYVYQENTNTFSIVTDIHAPGNAAGTLPGYIAAFGNRITVSVANSSQFFLSQINLGGSAFNPSTCFTIAGSSVFAQSTNIIRQMGVLNNTLYIFNDYLIDIWSNISAVFSGTNVAFPWKQNTTYNWNFGIANPTSLDINFGKMAWIARNSDGLLQFMVSEGGFPEVISTKAIDTLLQRYSNAYGAANPFLVSNSNGFLYQYEDTIFYRMSGGEYNDDGILDQEQMGNSIEFNFDIKEWHRCIEANGERNRIQFHVYFNYNHLVTIIGEGTVYNMSGQYYYNEIRNPNQSNPQAIDAYLAYPFRYERITPIISQSDYSEFETEYVEIDFVFGDSNINYSTEPFINTQFIIDEEALNGEPQYIVAENTGIDGQPIFMITDGISNFPSLSDTTYNTLFNPHIELYWSDDGGKSFNSADVREFSQMGVYMWRMRWYQLGPSRNRVYKLICVSVVPIVVLGGVMNVRRISGGAN